MVRVSKHRAKRRFFTAEITPAMDGQSVLLKGWLYDLRDIGKIRFLILRDKEGFIQVTAKKGLTSDAVLELMKEIPRESVIAVRGVVKKSEQAPGGVEVVPESIEIINKALEVPPIDLTERSKTDLSKRLDWRFLDTRRKNIAPIFKVRSKIYKAIVNFFDSKGFININTPKLTTLGLESGAESFAVEYFDKKAWLAQSPQFYKQMFVIGGFERVYEIAPVFRAEKSHTTRHLTEFTGVDFEMGFIESEHDVMDVIDEMMKYVIEQVSKEAPRELEQLNVKLKVPDKIPRISMKEAKELLAGKGKELDEDDDLDAEAEKLLCEIVKEKYDEELVFVTLFPWSKRPFYHMRPQNNPSVTKSFDLLWNGLEVATGSQREHRLDILRKQAKEKGVKLDNIYAALFKYGAPPHGGAGLGLDRLTQSMLRLDNIREALLLPRDPDRIRP